MSTKHQAWIIAAVFTVAAIGLIGVIANDLWSGSSQRPVAVVAPASTAIKR